MATVLLSYQELGDRLQIKAESARKLAQRKRWRKVTANDGTTRVQVPEEELPDQDKPEQEQAAATTAAVYTKELETRIEGLKALVAASNARADAADARAIAAETDSDAWKQQADAWRDHAQRPLWRRIFG